MKSQKAIVHDKGINLRLIAANTVENKLYFSISNIGEIIRVCKAIYMIKF